MISHFSLGKFFCFSQEEKKKEGGIFFFARGEKNFIGFFFFSHSPSKMIHFLKKKRKMLRERKSFPWKITLFFWNEKNRKCKDRKLTNPSSSHQMIWLISSMFFPIEREGGDLEVIFGISHSTEKCKKKKSKREKEGGDFFFFEIFTFSFFMKIIATFSYATI